MMVTRTARRRIIISMKALIALLLAGSGHVLVAQQSSAVTLSRAAAVRVFSRSTGSSGSGAFISDTRVLTSFHVVTRVTFNGLRFDWQLHPDLVVILPAGDTIPATLASVPTDRDPSPLAQDFAILALLRPPGSKVSTVPLATARDSVVVGDAVVYSGFPLGARSR